MKKKEVTAYHEAGHAIAHLTVDRGFKKVSIIPTKEYEGICESTALRKYYPDDLDRRTIQRTKKKIFILLSGAAAEDRFTGKKKGLGRVITGDANKAMGLGRYLCGDKQLTAYLAYMWEVVNDNIDFSWEAVKKVAEALLEHGELTSKEVKILLGPRMIRYLELI